MRDRAQMGPTPRWPVVLGTTFVTGATLGVEIYTQITSPLSQSLFAALSGVVAVQVLGLLWAFSKVVWGGSDE